jgi:hypothetical protein
VSPPGPTATTGGRPVHPYLEYGGLTSIPGPFRCRDARIVLLPLKADPATLDALCTSVLGAPVGGPTYARVGGFVLLSFGTMTVSSESKNVSPLFATAYADMGTSPESHVALWVPVVARGPADGSAPTDLYAVFLPVMWVDNPVSLVGGREIYGIAKQWGGIDISQDFRTCSLEVFGGTFGATARTGSHPLLTVAPGTGVHPVHMAELAAAEARQMARDGLARLVAGEVDLPDAPLLHSMASALVGHEFDQVALRQFRIPEDDGSTGSPPELVGLTTRFHSVAHEFLGHDYRVDVTSVASHPLSTMFGIASQTAPFAIEVTADFTLSTA